MLVLGRRPGEYVMIGDKIKVQVVKSKEGDLRLAIEAPKEMQIMRGELLEDKDDESFQYQQRLMDYILDCFEVYLISYSKSSGHQTYQIYELLFYELVE